MIRLRNGASALAIGAPTELTDGSSHPPPIILGGFLRHVGRPCLTSTLTSRSRAQGLARGPRSRGGGLARQLRCGMSNADGVSAKSLVGTVAKRL